MIHPGRCDAYRRREAIRSRSRTPAFCGARGCAHPRIIGASSRSSIRACTDSGAECVRPPIDALVGQTPATSWAQLRRPRRPACRAARSWTSPAARAARCRSRAPCLLRWVPTASARSAKNSLKHQARTAEINAQISEFGAKSALLQGQRQEQASHLPRTAQELAAREHGGPMASTWPATPRRNILNTTDFASEADASRSNNAPSKPRGATARRRPTSRSAPRWRARRGRRQPSCRRRLRSSARPRRWRRAGTPGQQLRM